jgi:hypothetical protein
MFEIQEENFFERILSILFPPEIPRLRLGDSWRETVGYVTRMSRRGVENHPHMAAGVVKEPAKFKRVILLGPRKRENA